MRKPVVIATLALTFFSTAAHAGPAICYGHPLPTSRNLCLQAFEAGQESGLSERAVMARVKACGFVNFPSKIQGCLRALVRALGQDPAY